MYFSFEENDLIKLKDESGMEYAVVNLSELSGGNFSFYAPTGTYSVLYDGKGLISNEFKTYIERDFEISADAGHDFAITTGNITLDFNVNGRISLVPTGHGWILLMILMDFATSFNSVVLPAFGCATIIPRCPLPIGLIRSMIRMDTGAPGRSSRIFLFGKTGVISSKFKRLGVVSGA